MNLTPVPVLAAGRCRKGVKEIATATLKKIKAVKPPHPFEAYAHIISQIPKEDGDGFLITFPDLPGCLSNGETEAEAVTNGKDAFKVWVSARKDSGKEIPAPIEVQLRSKRKLIEQFIEENLPKLKPNGNVIAEFESYWTEHKQKAFGQLCADENINPAQLEKLLQNYVFANRLPRDQEIVEALDFKPKILERKSILERVADKIQTFIHTFIEGMGGIV